MSGWKEGYETGGNIQIFPRNPKSKVERMKALLNFTVDYIFTTKANGHKKLPIPSPLSTETFLSSCLDLNGEVAKHDMLRMRDILHADDFSQ